MINSVTKPHPFTHTVWLYLPLQVVVIKNTTCIYFAKKKKKILNDATLRSFLHSVEFYISLKRFGNKVCQLESKNE